MSFDIPLLIIISFLLCTAVIVFCSMRKFTTFRVYAVGNRQFSTASLVATALATYYGGATLVTNITRFPVGILWLSWQLLGSVLPFFVLSFLSKRMVSFIYHISMPETMGRLYGKYPRAITALLGCCYSIIYIATQVYILSQVISRCITSVNPVCITILATILLVAYTIFGGSRAVVLTDIWQSMTFFSLICLLAWFMFTKTSRPISETFAFVTTQKQFAWNALFVGQTKLALTLRYLTFIFCFIEPGYMQHIYMAAQPSQAKKVCLYAGMVSFIIMLCCMLVGAFVFTWLPPGIPQNETLNYILTHISPLFKGIFCICLLALTMSTADSRLHICSVMISYDILPILLRVRFRKHLSCVVYYRVAYIAMLTIATLGIFLSLNSSTLSAICTVSNWFGRFYIPIIAAPFILAVLGFRTTARNALIGMAAGGLAVIAWKKWVAPLLLTSSATFPCVLVNGLVMVAVHYLWPRSKRMEKLDDDGGKV